jgi:uncharacterized protein (DUF885 family)
MELCDQYIHELIQLVPELNDFHQLDEYKHLRSKSTNTLTKDFQKKERALYRKYYNLVSKKKQKSLYDLIFLDDLKIIIKESKYIALDHVPIDSLDNFPLSYVSALQGETDYRFTDKKSYQDFLNRFKTIPEITESILDNMKQGLKVKDTLPRIIVLDLRDQYKSFLEQDLDEIKVPSSRKKDIIKSIETYINPSVQKLKDFLENEYLCKCTDKIGLNSLTGGSTIYKGLVEEQTMKGYTPKDIHDLGLREVTRLMNLINAKKRTMKFKGSLQEFYKYTTDTFKDKKEIITYSKGLQKEIYKKIYPKYFNVTLLEKDLADIKNVSDDKSRLYAFYIGTKKRGTFYVNAHKYNDLNKHELLTLTLHETVPGHHLQLMTHNRSKKLPLYIQSSHNTGYIEGWGLYCENFTELHTDKEMVWKYIYELQRAIRLVIDTGIHAFNWSFDDCFTYMKKYLHYSDALIRNEIIRYICIPSQALSYKVGELTILFLRDRYLKKFPDDLKGFHDLVFEVGPCSLDLLVKEFIKKNI